MDGEEEVLPNLRAPFQLDIGIEDDWERLRREVAKEGTRQTQGRGSFQGVLLSEYTIPTSSQDADNLVQSTLFIVVRPTWLSKFLSSYRRFVTQMTTACSIQCKGG